MDQVITIHLIGGHPNGIRTANILNSAIKAVAFPKSQLKFVRKNLEDIDRPGVYILIGTGDSDESLAYIGMSDCVGRRLADHHSGLNGSKPKSFWKDTVVLVSKDENMTTSHAHYIESRLMDIADGNASWTYPDNKQVPSETAGKLPPAHRVVMEAYIDQAKILLGVLGWDMFREKQPRAEDSTGEVAPGAANPKIDSPTFAFRGEGYSAEMTVDGIGECTVKAGSIARGRAAPSITASAAALRAALLQKAILRCTAEALEFVTDYRFSTPSAAAAVVMGNSVNGKKAWKLADGQTFEAWEAAKDV